MADYQLLFGKDMRISLQYRLTTQYSDDNFICFDESLLVPCDCSARRHLIAEVVWGPETVPDQEKRPKGERI